MKKLLMILALFIAFSSYLAALSPKFNLGVGYRGTYVGAMREIEKINDLDSGLAVYLGVGLAFGQNDMLSFGAELAASTSFSAYPFPFGGFGLQLRGYFGIDLVKNFSITVVLGANLKLKEDDGQYYYSYDYYHYDSYYDDDYYYDDDMDDHGTNYFGDPVFGVRVKVFFLYAEYTMTLNGDFTDISRHEFGTGLMFDL